jgi:hypothetical protein
MSDDEVLEPEPEESGDPTPSFLAEARSIITSAVGVVLQRLVVIDEEVELASWRRFRRTIITGAVFFILMDRALDLAFRLHVDSAAGSTSGFNQVFSLISGWGFDVRQILFQLIWDSITLAPIALLIIFSAAYFVQKFLTRDEQSSNLVTLAQPIAIVWVQRLVFAGFFISLSDIFWRWQALIFPVGSPDQLSIDPSVLPPFRGDFGVSIILDEYNPLLFGSDTAQWLGVFTAAIGIGLIIYSYFLFKGTLTRLYADLRGYELWIALGILAFHFEILVYVATRGVTESPLGGLYWRIAQYIINL